MTDDAVLALCIGLQGNKSVESVDLSYNQLSSNSLECLIECIDAGLPLSRIYLSHNNIEEFSIGQNARAQYFFNSHNV